MESFYSENNKKNFFIALVIFLVLILSTVIYSSFFADDIDRDIDKDISKSNEDFKSETVVEEGPIESKKNNNNNNSEEDEFVFIINKKIGFKNSSAAGNVRIENPASNKYNFYVTIKLDNSDEIIYKSPVLEPNQHIKNDYLTKELSKGIYKAIATVFVIDPETEEELAQNQIEIELQIKK